MVISYRCLRLQLVCAPQGRKPRKKRRTTSALAIAKSQGETKEPAAQGQESESVVLLHLLDGDREAGASGDHSVGASLLERQSSSIYSISSSSDQGAYSDYDSAYNLLETCDDDDRNPFDKAADEELGPCWEALESVDNFDDLHWLLRPASADLHIDDKALIHLQNESDFDLDLFVRADGRRDLPYASCEPSFCEQGRDLVGFPCLTDPHPLHFQLRERAQSSLQNHPRKKGFVFPPQPSLGFDREIDRCSCESLAAVPSLSLLELNVNFPNSQTPSHPQNGSGKMDPALVIRPPALRQQISMEEHICHHSTAKPPFKSELGNMHPPIIQGPNQTSAFGVPSPQKPHLPPSRQAWHGPNQCQDRSSILPPDAHQQISTSGLQSPSQALWFVGQDSCSLSEPNSCFNFPYNFEQLEPVEETGADPIFRVPKSELPNAVVKRSKTAGGGTQIIINPRWPT